MTGSSTRGNVSQQPLYPLDPSGTEAISRQRMLSPGVGVKKQSEEEEDFRDPRLSGMIYRTERPGKFYVYLQ